MKRTGLCLITLLALTPFLNADVSLPTGSAGQVTLNWQKFNDLWTQMQSLEKKIEKLERPENPPPVPFSITKAAYQGRVENKKVVISGYFDIDVFDSKNWVKIPFLPSSDPAFDVLYSLEPGRALLWSLPDTEASTRRWRSPDRN